VVTAGVVPAECLRVMIIIGSSGPGPAVMVTVTVAAAPAPDVPQTRMLRLRRARP
jgi:hypothetical protein